MLCVVVESMSYHPIWKRGMLGGYIPITVESDWNKGNCFIAHCAANGMESKMIFVVGDSLIICLNAARRA